MSQAVGSMVLVIWVRTCPMHKLKSFIGTEVVHWPALAEVLNEQIADNSVIAQHLRGHFPGPG